MDDFTAAYIEAALWSSNDESTPQGGEPLDANFTVAEIASDTLETMMTDCARFQAENTEDIAADSERAGHDYWLTRCHHGAGFWDGDWPEPAASRLTDAAHRAGEFTLYIGDDGLIHGCRG
jgi:uncharacterized protein YaeQ